MADTSIIQLPTSWDFPEQHVEGHLTPNKFVSANSTLIAAGPAEATNEFGDTITVTPIGVAENATINQATPIQKVFEIGSKLAYLMRTPASIQMNIGRIMVEGKSLLGKLFSFYIDEDGPKIKSVVDGSLQTSTPHSTPNSSDFYINLQSEFFDQEIGLLFWFLNSVPTDDMPGTTVGTTYLERAMIESHQMQISAGAALLMEAVSIQGRRMSTLPVAPTSPASV